MPDTTHAILGASVAERFINCPGSVKLIQSLPVSKKDESSIWADEGTAAHKVGEKCLRSGNDAAHYMGTIVMVKGKEWEVTEEMAEAVQVYVDVVRAHLKRLGPTAQLFIEKKVYPIEGDDNLFGTADTIIVEDMVYEELVVYDYKHGAGVVVEVEQNDQGQYYSLGGLREHPNVKKITIGIAQPRASHPDGPTREVTVTPDELEAFGDVLVGAAAITEDPNAPLVAGKWCRFCPAKGASCPAQVAMAQDAVRNDFADLLDTIGPENISPAIEANIDDNVSLERLRQAWYMIPTLDYFIKGVRAMVQNRVELGEEVPFAKIVQGRAGNRDWKDKDDAKRKARLAARRAGVSSKALFKPKVLLSPTQLAKVKDSKGEKVFKKFVDQHCHRSEGKLSLVDVSDKRIAIPQSTTKEDYADLIDESTGGNNVDVNEGGQ